MIPANVTCRRSRPFAPAVGVLALLAAALLAPACLAQRPPASTAPRAAQRPRYEYRRDHDPDGTGKFYMGREIAQVMGHEAAEWLDRPEREQEEEPAKLLDALKLKPGMIVADIGAGSGFFSFRLAERVRPGGKVLAEEIQPEMLAIIRDRMKQRRVTNIDLVLGTVTDPRLPRAGVDLILLVDVYHEFDHPYEMGAAMVRALKPRGRLVFVEYRLEDPNVSIKLVHKMTEKQVRREMSVFPLRWTQTIEVLPRQHIIIFERPRAPAATRSDS